MMKKQFDKKMLFFRLCFMATNYCKINVWVNIGTGGGDYCYKTTTTLQVVLVICKTKILKNNCVWEHGDQEGLRLDEEMYMQEFCLEPAQVAS